MRYLMIAAFAGLAACSGHMKPGPLGQQVDLRQYLPDTLRAAAASPESTFRQEVAVGPNRARVELTWTTFRHGSGRYLASVSARLLGPVRYDSLSIGPVSELKNVGTKFDPSESAKMSVDWFKKTFFVHRSGVTPFAFDAQGRRTVWPAVAN